MRHETDEQELERMKNAAVVLEEPAILEGIKIRQQRMASGRKALEQFYSDVPRDDATLPAEVANQLRAVLFGVAHWSKYRGVLTADESEPYCDGPWVETGVSMDRELFEGLCAAMGLPRIRMDNHGDCASCKFGVGSKAEPFNNRGYGQPCGGCGYGLPSFIPRESEQVAP